MSAAVDLRLLRAAVFAAACVALTALGHLGGAEGGAGVAPWTAALGWLVLFAACVPLAGRRRRSLPAVTAVVACAQLGLHLLFSLGHGAGSADAAGHGAGHSGTGGGGVVGLAASLLCNDAAVPPLEVGEAERLVREAGLPIPPSGAEAAAALPGTGADGFWSALTSLATPAMLGGHLIAALLTGWLLLRGEAALWRLIQLSARSARGVPAALRAALSLALALLAPLLPHETRTRARRCRAVGGHHPTPATSGTVLPDAVSRRGPPPARQQMALAA